MPTKKTAIMLLTALMLGLLFFASSSYATDSASASKEIERIEYGDNVKTTYFTDGTTLVEVFASLTITTTTTATVTTTTFVKPEPINIGENIKLILEIIGIFVTIVGGILGIFGIKLYIGRRKNPPYIHLGQKNTGAESWRRFACTFVASNETNLTTID